MTESTESDTVAGRPRRRRSMAWIYYTLLAVVSLVVAISSSPAALVPFFICSAYAIYLYRGGRFVVWFW